MRAGFFAHEPELNEPLNGAIDGVNAAHSNFGKLLAAGKRTVISAGVIPERNENELVHGFTCRLMKSPIDCLDAHGARPVFILPKICCTVLIVDAPKLDATSLR